MNIERRCLGCQDEVKGRSDRKFCSDYCRSLYHYEQNKSKADSLYKTIDKQLKINRRILKKFNLAGKSTVDSERLVNMGFIPNYFTHYWKNGKGDVFLFCYEFGFLKRVGRNGVKYVLVEWQTYMGNLRD